MENLFDFLENKSKEEKQENIILEIIASSLGVRM